MLVCFASLCVCVCARIISFRGPWVGLGPAWHDTGLTAVSLGIRMRTLHLVFNG